MLNFIRQKKEKMKWVLWLVIIALAGGMLLLFVTTPSGGGQEEMGNFVAKVDGSEVSVNTFRSNLLSILNRLGPQARQNPETVKQYGQMMVDNMVRSLVLAQEAERYGFTVTDEEVMEYIVNIPNFNEDGEFIGMEEYRSRLKSLGLTPEEYELSVRQGLLADKLENFVSGSASVSADELKTQFVEDNDKAKIEYVAIPNSNFIGKVQIDEPAVAKYYESHKEDYRIGETREVKYILLETGKLSSLLSSNVTEQEIRAEYEANKAQRYQEMVHASHILIKVEANAPADVVEKARQKAAGILAEVRQPGASFADLATKYSEDEGSGKQGGDLSFFPRGRMVPEFDNVAFALKPGEISDLVKTQFGFHIIRCNSRRDFDFYKGLISRNLAKQKADDQLKPTAEQARQKAVTTKNLDAVAKEYNGTVETSKAFNPENPDYSLGAPREFTDAIFKLNLNEFGEVTQTFRGYIIPQLTKILPTRIQTYDEVRTKVQRDYRNARSAEMARSEAYRLLEEARAQNDLTKAAKGMSQVVETSGEFNLNGNVSNQLGVAPELAAAALRLEPQQFGGPREVKNFQVVFRVLERSKPDLTQMPAQKQAITDRLMREKGRLMFEALVEQVMARYKSEERIKMNQELIDRILS